MIVLTTSSAQVLAVGQALVFDTALLNTNKCNCHNSRRNSGGVYAGKNGIYKVTFNGNITSTATGLAELQVEVNGVAMPETAMLETIATAANIANVGASTAIANCCGSSSTFTVVNTGAIPVTVSAGACIIVEHICDKCC